MSIPGQRRVVKTLNWQKGTSWDQFTQFKTKIYNLSKEIESCVVLFDHILTIVWLQGGEKKHLKKLCTSPITTGHAAHVPLLGRSVLLFISLISCHCFCLFLSRMKSKVYSRLQLSRSWDFLPSWSWMGLDIRVCLHQGQHCVSYSLI